MRSISDSSIRELNLRVEKEASTGKEQLTGRKGGT